MTFLFIYSKSPEEHAVHLKLILKKLREHKLYAKFSKCKFWLDTVIFMGHVVLKDEIQVDPAKVETVADWKQSETVIEIRSFLGLASY
jgi:hypothetical protein